MHKSTAAGKCIIGRNSDSDSIMLFRVGILDKRFYLPLIIGIIETNANTSIVAGLGTS